MKLKIKLTNDPTKWVRHVNIRTPVYLPAGGLVGWPAGWLASLEHFQQQKNSRQKFCTLQYYAYICS